MMELRKVIQALLKSVHPRVYRKKAPETAVYPYVVYLLSTSTNEDPREDFILEVDIWDKPVNGDTTTIETLTDSIDALLNRKHSVAEKVLVNFYRANRQDIPDEDDDIERRKLTYQAKTYFL